MNPLKRLLKTLLGVSSGYSEGDPVSRCLRCGAGLDKEYRTCPKCGGEFVGLIDGESENDRD